MSKKVSKNELRVVDRDDVDVVDGLADEVTVALAAIAGAAPRLEGPEIKHCTKPGAAQSSER